MTTSAPPAAVPAAPAAVSAADALRSRAFRLLTAVWVSTNLADSVLALILAVWVQDLTGSNAAAGLVLAALGLPALVSPALGQVADRVSRRRMVVVSYLVGAGTLLTLFAVRGPEHVPLVLAVTVVYSAVGFATGAAQSGLLRDLLPDDALGTANARLTTIDQAFRLVLPVVGAGVYALVGPLPLVAAAVAGFVVAAALAAGLRIQETPPTPAADRGRFLTEATAGFRHLLRTPPLGRLTVALGTGFAAVGVLNGVSFAVIEHGLGLDAELIGPLSSAQALTAIVAGLTAARLLRRWGARRLVGVALAVTGLGVVPLLGSNLVAVVLGMGAVGLGVTWAVVGFVTERQVRTPATLQGRTQAASTMLFNVPQLVTTVAAAGALGVLDHRVLVGLTAAGLLVAAALAAADRRTPGLPGHP